MRKLLLTTSLVVLMSCVLLPIATASPDRVGDSALCARQAEPLFAAIPAGAPELPCSANPTQPRARVGVRSPSYPDSIETDGAARASLSALPSDRISSRTVEELHCLNSPPAISGLPDRSLDEDDHLNDAIDLWSHAYDVETPDSGLSFTIDNTPDPGAGVSVDSNRLIDIDPAPNWYGSTPVRIKVEDPEGACDTDTFQVTVNPVNDVPRIAPQVPDRKSVV